VGVLALDLLTRMYRGKADLPRIAPKHWPVFRTRLESAVELLRRAETCLRPLGKPLWVVVDGAYAKPEFLKPAKALGVTVVNRLRCDATLGSLPLVVPAGQRGPGRVVQSRRKASAPCQTLS
jgi:hypothetical protein